MGSPTHRHIYNSTTDARSPARHSSTVWVLHFSAGQCTVHRARETVELLTNATSDFIPHTLWPPNSPDLNPVDHKIWSVTQEKVYQSQIEDVDELRERKMAAWEELDQPIIDTAVRQCRSRLHACVKAKGDHFEHKRPWLNDDDKVFNHSILTVGFYSNFRIYSQMCR